MPAWRTPGFLTTPPWPEVTTVQASILSNYMEKHGNNLGLEGPRGNGNGAAPPGAGTKIFRHRLHISPFLCFYLSYCRNFLPSIFERALLLVSPPSPHGMSKCKRFSVTANQHDASSIVELSLPLTLPAPRNNNMAQKALNVDLHMFYLHSLHIFPILSSSELGETSPGRSAVTQCIEASSSGSSGISTPSTLALPTPVAMAIFWSYTLNDFGCWACKCCNVSSDTSFISTTVSRCWSASSSAGSCGHVPQICLKRPS